MGFGWRGGHWTVPFGLNAFPTPGPRQYFSWPNSLCLHPLAPLQPLTVNGKAFNDAAKWEALQYAMGKVSNMRSAPDTQDELKGTRCFVLLRSSSSFSVALPLYTARLRSVSLAYADALSPFRGTVAAYASTWPARQGGTPDARSSVFSHEDDVLSRVGALPAPASLACSRTSASHRLTSSLPAPFTAIRHGDPVERQQELAHCAGRCREVKVKIQEQDL